MWKARAEKAEAELANLRAEYDGAMEVDRTELAACAEKIATLADERETRAALEAQIVTLRNAAEFETERVAAAVLREREECAKIAATQRDGTAPTDFERGWRSAADVIERIIRARSK